MSSGNNTNIPPLDFVGMGTNPYHTNHQQGSALSQAAVVQNNMCSEISDDDYNEFFRIYLFGTEEERADAVDKIMAYSDFNPNYDEGMLFVRAAEKGDLHFLSKLITTSSQNATLTDNIQSALIYAAYGGHLACVQFLVEKGATPQHLLGTTAYTNCPAIKAFFDKIIAEQHTHLPNFSQ